MRHAELRSLERKLEPILGAERAYDFGQTPANFYATPESERLTTNCKDVGHEVLRHTRGIILPHEIQLLEAFSTPLFSRVPRTNELHLGDWIMLGRPSARDPRSFVPEFGHNGELENWDDFDVNHLAVYLGRFRGLELVIHASPEANGAEIASLGNIMGDLRTSVVHDVLRVSPTALAA